jgi:hypothetical protein
MHSSMGLTSSPGAWVKGRNDVLVSPRYELVEDRSHASSAEVLECFLEEKQFLSQLAFLITGDQATADQSLLNACEITVKGRSPFRDWLLEWAKAATITNAISKCAETKSEREAGYKDQGCSHNEHTLQLDGEQRTAKFNILLKTDTLKVVEELDALSRAVLVLRLAIGSSIQDCALRLNVDRATGLVANCRAMTWLYELRRRQCRRNNQLLQQKVLTIKVARCADEIEAMAYSALSSNQRLPAAAPES